MLQVYEAAARACAHINIRASRARMMTINRGINGVSDKDPMRDVEVAPDAPARVAVRSPAARSVHGSVPRGETVARFGVRSETIELVRGFFNISGLCHLMIILDSHVSSASG